MLAESCLNGMNQAPGSHYAVSFAWHSKWTVALTWINSWIPKSDISVRRPLSCTRPQAEGLIYSFEDSFFFATFIYLFFFAWTWSLSLALAEVLLDTEDQSMSHQLHLNSIFKNKYTENPAGVGKRAVHFYINCIEIKVNQQNTCKKNKRRRQTNTSPQPVQKIEEATAN